MEEALRIRDEIPPMKDLTAHNITENVHTINSRCPDPRLRFLMGRLVDHLHDFARETRLSTKEWMAAIEFLTATGHMCTDLRQEFILLSDVFGLSLVVQSINNPKPPPSTEGTLLGPFHTHDAETFVNGQLITRDPAGESLLVLCTVKDSKGQALQGVKIDIWETDSSGFYDTQIEGRTRPDGRGVLISDAEGAFWFKAIVPVPYPIPVDGPVGIFLKSMNRHAYRPSHMHFMFEKPGYDHLITALYVRNDPFETSDAVFGVKSSLLVEFSTVNAELARKYDVKEECRLLQHDFVLVSDEDSTKLREEESRRALRSSGTKFRFQDGLPIPDVD